MIGAKAFARRAVGALVMVAAGFAGVGAAEAPAGGGAAVHIVRLGEKDLVPDVAMDGKGILHMVYGNDHIAYYVRSADNGQTLSRPVKVNSEGTVETEMGERGPKLAVDGSGVIHVVWTDKWKPGVKTMVRYARSSDEGKTFSPQQALSTMAGVDGVTVTADDKGHVVAFWHVMEGPKPEVKSATWLFEARSSDGGKTFGRNEAVKIDNLSPLACSMCMMRARTRGDGKVYVAFRSAVKSIRDFYLLKGPIGENAFTAVRINNDNWELPECPMCGPSLSFVPGEQGRAVAAFMTEHKVYWSVSTAGMEKFELHVATPGNEEDEIYPCAVANKAGEVLLVWQVGPMSVKDTATVKWATYGLDGKATGEKGTVGKSYSGTKATAFVGTDDGFYIVTTAK